MESDEVRSVYFILAAVYRRVRASRTTARFDCTKAEAPVLRKCYENFGYKAVLLDDWLRRGKQRATLLQRRAAQAQPQPSLA